MVRTITALLFFIVLLGCSATDEQPEDTLDMARTVESPIQLPIPAISSNTVIQPAIARTDVGIVHSALSQNTLYEQHRGTIVHDNRWGNGFITDYAPGNIAYYRTRNECGTNSGTYNVDARIGLLSSAATGTADVTVKIGSETRTVSISVAATGTQYFASATLNYSSVLGATQDIEVEIVSAPANCVVNLVHLSYKRDKSTLESVGTGLNYGDDFRPFDTTLATVAHKPVTSQLARQFQTNAGMLLTKRLGSFLTSADPNGVATWSVTKQIPKGVDTIRAAFHGGNSAASRFLRVTVEGETVDLAAVATGGWVTHDFTVKPNTRVRIAATPFTLATFPISFCVFPMDANL